MDNALEISNLGKSFPGFLLDDVSFTLPAGHIMGLIGPNGAGKTTIIKLILNLLSPDAGRITVFGQDHRTAEVEVKKRIGFVHEVPCFFEHLSLRSLASLVSAYYPTWDDDRFQRLLAGFGLPLRKPFRRLSRGMKMKFSLALALAHDADLVLLDEPTSGLDPLSRGELLDLLLQLMQDERKSVLFSTQITSDLERIADYVTFIREGRLVFSACKELLLERWRIVKSDRPPPEAGSASWIKGLRRHEFGFEALTDDVSAAQRNLGATTVVEKAGLDDIMYFLTRGGSHV